MSTSEFRLRIEDGRELDVRSASGTERLSRCYRFDLVVFTGQRLDAASLIARRAVLELDVGGKSRSIAGIIERVSQGESVADGELLKLRLVPSARSLALRRLSRVFQGHTSAEIARIVMTEHGVGFRADLAERGRVREYCVQHEEADLAFVERLFAEEGYAYRFSSSQDAGGAPQEDVLTVFDRPTAYRELPEGGALVYRPDAASGGGALHQDEAQVGVFLENRRASSAGAVLSAFDLRRPRDPWLKTTPAFDREVLVVHEHHGPYAEQEAEPQDPGVVLEQLRRRARTFHGESRCVRLTSGAAIDLAEHPALSGQYAIVAVEHSIVPPRDGQPRYSNVFRAVAREQLFRPPRPRRRVRQSLETATVVGPARDEIHTDHLGRIKVRFHWDLEGPREGETSCWIRVAQSWAGAGYGAQFIPRVGMEVLVAFLGGDPDRPVVTGCLANATHPPPFPVPGAATRSGWRTNSSPSSPHGGANELSFDDAAGAEKIRLAAHRELEVQVGETMNTVVSRDQNVVVGGESRVAIAGSARTSITGHAESHFAGGAALDVNGQYDERIRGRRSAEITDACDLTVSGAFTQTARGNRKDVVAGTWSTEAEGTFTLLVGKAERSGHAEIQVRGTSIQRSDGAARIESRESLTLVCGESRIELTPDAVTIRAPSVRLAASENLTVEGKGPALRLSDRAELVADTLKLRGKQASLSLDDDAKLKGGSVQFGRGDPLQPTSEKNSAPNTKRLSVRLLDPELKPYASKRYELRAATSTFEGETNGDGLVAHDVPEDAKVAALELWTGDYPTGPRRTYTLVIDELAGVDELAGFRARLQHLGYYRGSLDGDELDAGLVSAILAFQRDHKLQTTGTPDDATKAAIIDLHGH